jgi:hypothetical protein
MGSPAGGALRVIRTLAITAVIVGLAAIAHVAGGGATPRPLGLAGLALGTAYVCAWAARRRLGPVAITGLLAAGQWVLHHALDALGTPVCVPVVADVAHADHAGHVAAAAGACAPALTGTAAGLTAGHAASGATMLAAHVVATVVTALLLVTGERSVWALHQLLSALRPAVPRPVAVAVPRVRQAVRATPVLRPRRAALLRVSPRRGPPAAGPRSLARLAL